MYLPFHIPSNNEALCNICLDYIAVYDLWHKSVETNSYLNYLLISKHPLPAEKAQASKFCSCSFQIYYNIDLIGKYYFLYWIWIDNGHLSFYTGCIMLLFLLICCK